MLQLGLWLFAVGAGDLAAGLSGRPSSRVRTAIAIALSIALSVGGSLTLGASFRSAILLGLITFVTECVWLVPQREAVWSPARSSFLLLAIGLGTVCMVLFSGSWPQPHPGRAAEWIGRIPFRLVRGHAVGQLAFVAGVLLALQATANAVVRLVLEVAGSDPLKGEEQLKGGRMIGPLERSLIFGLAAAGELTAAGFIISAKSLLRFPELTSGKNGPGIHVVTEYFLVGSLSSWALALVPVPLLR